MEPVLTCTLLFHRKCVLNCQRLTPCTSQSQSGQHDLHGNIIIIYIVIFVLNKIYGVKQSYKFKLIRVVIN